MVQMQNHADRHTWRGCHSQIGITISVVVGYGDALPVSALIDSSERAYFFEAPISACDKELVRRITARHINVDMAVVVRIREYRGSTIAQVAHSRLRRNVDECAVALHCTTV